MSNGLRVENISYRYRSNTKNVLDQVSCNFKSGEVSAVVGPSGCGKTTLLSIIAGLDKPSEGEIYYNGQPYSELDLDRLRRENISMIFQNYNLLPFCTVLENVSYPMELIGYSQADSELRAKEYLSLVGIDELKYQRFPSKLSGGEQQRVAIARALTSGAQIILADEPTGNLDEENGARIIEILHTLAHNNMYIIIIVTHNMDVAQLSDTVFRIRDGNLKSIKEGNT